MDDFIQLYVLPWLFRALLALAIFLVGKWLAQRLTRVLARVLERSRLDVMLVKFLSNLAYAAMLVAVVLAAVDTLGVSVTSFLAIVGAAGLAVGLALKDSLSNFAAGVMIIVFRPFTIGDAITAGGTSGSVDEIGMFATLLRTPDNQRIIVPNSAIITGNIVNMNALGVRRIDLLIAISYEDDLEEAKRIITNLVTSDPRVLDNPAFGIGVMDYTPTAINLYVWPWVRPENYWGVRTEMLERMRIELRKAGFSTPYPRQELVSHVSDKAPVEERAPVEKPV